MPRRYWCVCMGVLSLLLVGWPSWSALDVKSNGLDDPGPFASDNTIDLSLAPTGAWNDPNRAPGNGVYDPDIWAVVFHYTSATIGNNVDIRFKPHPSGAPVVWLVSGDVVIGDGSRIHLAGTNNAGTQDQSFSDVPPGAFRGGRADGSIPGSAGYGPGGGSYPGLNGASYGTAGTANDSPTYGNPRVYPLIGGSGGAGGRGGSGGGAILIAANGTIELKGGGANSLRIDANGGNDWGSGGAIRLIANRVFGDGRMRAEGDAVGSIRAGAGRIRVEANVNELVHLGDPAFTEGLPCANPEPPVGDPEGPPVCDEEDTIELFPDPDVHPFVEIITVDSKTVVDPTGDIFAGLQDVTTSTVTIVVEARTKNVPTPSDAEPWTVELRVVPKSGADTRLNMTFDRTDSGFSYWRANTVGLTNGISTLQVRAFKP